MASEIGFSIITTSRNAAGHIARCLDSVARQTYERVEHVVVDGASTDGTQGAVTAHGRRVTKFISEPDTGIYDAMNKGIALASGDYLLFLGADDYLADDGVLADLAAFLEQQDRPDVVYGDLEVREGSRKSVFCPPPPADALAFLVSGCLPHQSTAAHRRVFEQFGPFNLKYRVHGDYDWFLRMFTTPGVRIEYMHRVIGSFAMGGTSSQLRRGQDEFYAIQNALPLYREPQWIDRRLQTFQHRITDLRVELQDRRAILGRHLASRIVRKLKRTLFPGQANS